MIDSSVLHDFGGFGVKINARKLLTGPVKPEFDRPYILWSKDSHIDIGKSTTIERCM